MEDSVTVAIRVRPMNELESKMSGKRCISVDSKTHVSLTSQSKTYNFDYVADEYVSQSEIFDSIGKPIADSCIAGLNGSIFAYGQTGAGKTYTIQGVGTDPESRHRGLLPRCFEYIFSQLKPPFSVKCSYLEIYQEQIIDLLADKSPYLSLREDARRGVYVDGLLEVAANNVSETIDLLKIGLQNRHVASTAMNCQSSRSHAVFSMIIRNKNLTSKFHLIDLAGSERQKATAATGERLKEASKINKSLSALGNVVNALAHKKQRHVHYRDSKLTFLLKDSLGGNCKTCLIANVSQSYSSLGETASTLQFALRAKTIKCKVTINDHTSEVERLREELRRVKGQLEEARQKCPICNGVKEYIYETDSGELRELIEKFKTQYANKEKIDWEDYSKNLKTFVDLARRMKEDMALKENENHEQLEESSEREGLISQIEKLKHHISSKEIFKWPEDDISEILDVPKSENEENITLRQENAAIFEQLESYTQENLNLIEQNDFLKQENFTLRNEIAENNETTKEKIADLQAQIQETSHNFMKQIKQKEEIIERLQTKDREKSMIMNKLEFLEKRFTNVFDRKSLEQFREDTCSEISQDTRYESDVLKQLKLEYDALNQDLKKSQLINLEAKQTIESFHDKMIDKNEKIYKLKDKIVKASKEILMWKKCVELKNEEIWELKDLYKDILIRFNSDESLYILYEEIKIKNQQIDLLKSKVEEKERKILENKMGNRFHKCLDHIHGAVSVVSSPLVVNSPNQFPSGLKRTGSRVLQFEKKNKSRKSSFKLY